MIKYIIKQAPLWHTLVCTYTPVCNDFYIFLISLHLQTAGIDESKSITLSLEGCPPGRSLGVVHSTDRYECDCDKNNTNILSCEPNGYDVVLKVSSSVRSLQRGHR